MTQTFRNLFRSEVIKATEGIAIRDVTLLFTDLKGSTRAIPAYRRPQRLYAGAAAFRALVMLQAFSYFQTTVCFTLVSSTGHCDTARGPSAEVSNPKVRSRAGAIHELCNWSTHPPVFG